MLILLLFYLQSTNSLIDEEEVSADRPTTPPSVLINQVEPLKQVCMYQRCYENLTLDNSTPESSTRKISPSENSTPDSSAPENFTPVLKMNRHPAILKF